VSDYTVKALAALSGVSVRTLHHYDEIGLLKPAHVGANGYRYYGRDELLRLQQILIWRELEFPLELIGQMLSSPRFDLAATLRSHRERLSAEAARYRRLVRTVDQTLASLDGDKAMKDQDLYKGFDAKKQAEREAWLVDRYGEDVRGAIETSRAVVREVGPTAFAECQAEVASIEAALGRALIEGQAARSEAVQALIERHFAWVRRWWGGQAESDRAAALKAYAGLAGLYEEHPDFRTRYEAVAPGLTEYLAEGMRAFAAAG
jgi:DNA-binding transcriptional MerR regulator